MNRELRSLVPITADLRVVLVLSLVGAIWLLGLWPGLFLMAILWAGHSIAEAVVGTTISEQVSRAVRQDPRRGGSSAR